MASGFRNEGEMRSAQLKPLIDTRHISEYRRNGCGWPTYLMLAFTALVWVILILAESGYV